ncbi:hypothetical protein PMAA_051660 [Talaromyces marneffei ATCC 18224]|uniref:Uncharacterized protein n=1 Tax=Talaromyces marneffei (strain ATCC 18224 / CBS 334.59 / QM 7333) TaxID=441960 RepID=B6QN16_TALMQ|nr:hypothetical protein PMAA_051660 [Talaromyces marneffei ATCC 18224]
MMSDTKSLTCLRAIHLRLQYLASYVIEDPAHYLDVEVLRSQTPFYHEFLSLAKIALRAAGQEIGNPAHHLSLQCSLACPAEQWRRLWCREFVFEDCGSRIVLRYLDKDQGMGEWQLIEEVTEVRPTFADGDWTRRPLTGSSGLLMEKLYSKTLD